MPISSRLARDARNAEYEGDMTEDRTGENGATNQPKKRTAADIVAEGASQPWKPASRPAKTMGETISVSGFATWLEYSLYGFCLFCVLKVLADFNALSFFSEVQNGAFSSSARDAAAEGNRVDQVAALATLGFFFTLLSSALAYGFFFSRSLKNLQAVHEADRDMKPFGLWAWYFVPIMSLWKPLEGFSEVRYGSRRAEGKGDDASGLVGIWWAAWIGYLIISNVADRLLTSGLESGEVETLVLAAYTDIAAMIVAFVAAYILVRFVGEIARGQEQVQFMSSASAFD